LLEREAFMMADFDVDVVAVAAQPLAFLWPRQIKGSTYHVPDFFVRLSNGDGRIVDVKRLAAVGSSVALATGAPEGREVFARSAAGTLPAEPAHSRWSGRNVEQHLRIGR